MTFSLSVAFGPLLGYASFNKFHANYLRFVDMLSVFLLKDLFPRDCLIVTACDCFTSVSAGIFDNV